MIAFFCELLIFAVLAPFFGILFCIFFGGTNLVTGLTTMIQHLPFVDSFAKILGVTMGMEDVFSYTVLVFLSDTLSAILMGTVFHVFKGFANVLGLQKLPIIRTLLYFFMVLVSGIVINLCKALGGIGTILAETGGIIIMLIGIYIMSKGVFSGLPVFGSVNIAKLILGIIIDSLLVVIITAYLTLVSVCMTMGFGALTVKPGTFICIIIITVVAISIDAMVKLALRKDGL